MYSTDTLMVRLLLADKDRYLRAFKKDDFSTPGGQLIHRIIKQGRPLASLGIYAKTEEQKVEANLLIENGKEIVSSDLEAISADVIRATSLNRILIEALNGNNSQDLGKLSREIISLQKVDLGKSSKPVRGEWKEFLKRAYENKGNTIPTGITEIDLVLEGGLRIGELGIIMAPTYRGKTYALVQIAVGALLQGISVFWATPEISGENLLLRCAQNTLNMERADILSSDPKKIERKLSRAWKAPFRVHLCRGVERELYNIIKQIYSFGPGLILLDAFEQIRDHGIVESWKQAGNMVLDLRDTIEEVGGAIWTTVQTNRGAYRDDKEYSMASVSESIAKIQNADVIITLQQTSGDLAAGRMGWNIEKARERIGSTDSIYLRTRPEVQRLEGY